MLRSGSATAGRAVSSARGTSDNGRGRGRALERDSGGRRNSDSAGGVGAAGASGASGVAPATPSGLLLPLELEPGAPLSASASVWAAVEGVLKWDRVLTGAST